MNLENYLRCEEQRLSFLSKALDQVFNSIFKEEWTGMKECPVCGEMELEEYLKEFDENGNSREHCSRCEQAEKRNAV